jgi:plasmid stability protein
MPNVLIRGLDDRLVEKLKKRAARNERSLQAELKLLIEQAAAVDISEFRARVARIRKELSGRKHSDSAELIAEDRQR